MPKEYIEGRHVLCTDCHHLVLRQKVGRFFQWLRSRSEFKELDAGARAIPIYRDRFPADDGLQIIDQVKQDPCFGGKIER